MVQKSIVLGISGGIAAYKAAGLASLLVKQGFQVQTVMTKAATEFITPLTLQALTKQPVYVDVLAEQDPTRISHVAMADQADAIIIAPATADVIARIAHGLADDMLTSILLVARCPVIVAPSMNVHMYEHPLVQKNLRVLRELGYIIAEPDEGMLACGYVGKGRLLEPSDLAEILSFALSPKPLQGKKILVTAGPTKERIDPVRYVTNDSTGTMGYALARCAWKLGAHVTLLSGAVNLLPGIGIDVISVSSAIHLQEEVEKRIAEVDMFIMTAAVADYRPQTTYDYKWKKTDDVDTVTWTMVRNPDILVSLKGKYKPGAYVIGFAAETHDVDRYARKKLVDKGVDLLVVNNVLEYGAGFGTGTNRVDLYFQDGRTTALPLASKMDVATMILQQALVRMGLVDDEGMQE